MLDPFVESFPANIGPLRGFFSGTSQKFPKLAAGILSSGPDVLDRHRRPGHHTTRWFYLGL